MPLIRLLLGLRGFLARSWWLSRGLYRLHGLPLLGPPHEEVWYFAYGANMHDSAFRGWRGMRPLDWRPGRVRGHRLCFNLEGRLTGRAAPANLCPDPQAEVWGVLYRLTRRDLVRLDATEGIPWGPYRPLWVEAEDSDGILLRAVTYIARGSEVEGRPSLRYITLLAAARAGIGCAVLPCLTGEGDPALRRARAARHAVDAALAALP